MLVLITGMWVGNLCQYLSKLSYGFIHSALLLILHFSYICWPMPRYLLLIQHVLCVIKEGSRPEKKTVQCHRREIKHNTADLVVLPRRALDQVRFVWLESAVADSSQSFTAMKWPLNSHFLAVASYSKYLNLNFRLNEYTCWLVFFCRLENKSG